ncbi:hypothetical protein G3T36_01750 [Diaminobutyricibacter tongyongensis]|uniref:Solute-binding protein family 5 domain-containing protein n=1 Tax=Leifsonia tongyongensis TaxID=1268043 RepID=A0A6L9XTI6_9MICO|nr:ABC transporter substrate-binding protein [Diaminobutyricibacter tongyongensis]NEN04587.1 hypothetical protein [Diaminobutyricibacter tongyongensis]
MTQTIAIEIDTRPSTYLSSREFTGHLLDRQLHRPLFREDALSLVPDLLSVHDKIDDRAWVFRLADDATWGTGDPVTADDVAKRLFRIAQQPRGSWIAALIKRCDVLDGRTLKVTTRQRIAILDRALANPTLAPRRRKHSSGAYALSWVRENRATLVPRDGNSDVIELVTTSSRAEGRRRFLSGTLDIGWGIGVPPKFWDQDDPGPFLATPGLDMFVILAAGPGVPQEAANRILDSIGLDRNAPAGIEPTVSRFSSYPFTPGKNAEKSTLPAGRWPLFYTEFPPNRETAVQLARASDKRLVPTPVSYSTMLAGPPKAGFSLQIHATQFPDTLGLQVESLLIARGSIPAPDALKEVASSLWEMESDTARRECARAAEISLDQTLRRRVIGRLRPRFRSRSPINMPRSGWFDFKQLTKGNCST